MTTELAHVDGRELAPAAFAEMVAAAHQKAKTLESIVEQAKLYTIINERKYLQVEAWQTIGRAYGYTARSGEVEIVYDQNGTELGLMARSTIYDANGTAVGGAEGYCMNDETTWANRPFYARAGMAQTRSISRGFRQMLSWVVVLAGYAPTPAEEMTGDERPLQSQAPADMCPVHHIAFFQRGKMREPAHLLPDGKTWCNKSKVVPVVKAESVNQEAPGAVSNEATTFFIRGRELGFDSAQALASINSKTWTEWTQKGNTLTQALQRLLEAHAQVPPQAATPQKVGG